MTDYIVLGFSGKIGVGKNYIAEEIFVKLLNEKYGNEPTMILAFADPLKEVCAARHGTSYEKLYVEKDEITRKRLQDIGDEFRNTYTQSYYANWMKFQIKLHSVRSGIKRFIITDVRFPEELSAIRELKGYIYRIVAPNRNKKKLYDECQGDVKKMEIRANHRSETSLDNFTDLIYDAVFDNDDNDSIVADCKRSVLSLGK